MTAWSYRVPPGITVTVKAKSRPALLSHCLGQEIAPRDDTSLVLDLVGRSNGTARGPLSVDPVSGALTVRGVYKAIPWSCRVLPDAKAGWTLEFSSPVLREYLALHVALLPTLRRLLLDRGVALVTGAAFERGGAATLLAGLTGHGKTAALLGALERGASLIGDEYVGLSERAEVTPVVRALALRQATLAPAPRTLRRLSPGRGFALRAAQIAALVTRGWIHPVIHVSPFELGARTSDTSQSVQRLFWLEVPGGTDPGVRCERMDVSEAVDYLATMQAVHDLAYGDMGTFLDPAAVGRAGTAYATRWRETVGCGLRGVSCYKLTFSRGRDVRQKVVEHILDSKWAAGGTPGQPPLAGG